MPDSLRISTAFAAFLVLGGCRTHSTPADGGKGGNGGDAGATPQSVVGVTSGSAPTVSSGSGGGGIVVSPQPTGRATSAHYVITLGAGRP